MNDVSIGRVVDSVMRDYDNNRNGVIDLSANSFKDESFFDDDRITHEGNQTVRTITRYSNADLFTKSDADQDGKVTREELTNFISKYDKDQNGKLTERSFWDWLSGKPEGELDVFNREVPERSRVIYRQVISVDPQPPYPQPPFPQPHFRDGFLASRR